MPNPRGWRPGFHFIGMPLRGSSAAGPGRAIAPAPAASRPSELFPQRTCPPMYTACSVIVVESRVSPPVTLTHVGDTFAPVAFASHRAAVSQSVPANAPPVVTTTKYDPSGENATSRTQESNAVEPQRGWYRSVFQLAIVADVAPRSSLTTWSWSTPLAFLKLPMTTSCVPSGDTASLSAPTGALAPVPFQLWLTVSPTVR